MNGMWAVLLVMQLSGSPHEDYYIIRKVDTEAHCAAAITELGKNIEVTAPPGKKIEKVQLRCKQLNPAKMRPLDPTTHVDKDAI